MVNKIFPINILFFQNFLLSILIALSTIAFSGCSSNSMQLATPTRNYQKLPATTGTPVISNPTTQINPTSIIENEFIETPHPIGTPTQEMDILIETTPTQETTNSDNDTNIIEYQAQSGDTLLAVAAHFGVTQDEILSPEPLHDKHFLQPGQILFIPRRLENTSPSDILLPDSEVVFSSSAADFDIQAYINSADGFLNDYGELRGTGWKNGSDIIGDVAIDFSINPRLLLALLEYQSHWVYGNPTTREEAYFPLGYANDEYVELFQQLNWTSQTLNIGYYGWRDGSLTELVFKDESRLRLAPDLNAGTVAVLYYFSKVYEPDQWQNSLYGPENYYSLHNRMFGDAWQRARTVEPLIPAGLTQPEMELPIEPGRPWNLTGGPHSAWGTKGVRAAIDFAPSGISGCAQSKDWITAASSGLVVRVGEGPVIVDMDRDGYEQTGWNTLYMHIASKDRVLLGDNIDKNGHIGHPSCYGGRSTGTHLHFARKYNGEWMLAEGPVPMVLSGWETVAAATNYKGSLIKDEETIISSESSEAKSLIVRE